MSKTAQAYRIPPEASIKIDGRLDDEVWQAAAFTSDFVQKEPVEGAAPTERTEVAFAYDGKHLYVGARMYSENPEDIRAVMTRRDDDGNSERLIVSIDGYKDRRTAYSFAVTAAGVRLDWYGLAGRESDRRRGVDGRDGDPLLAAPLPVGRRTDVGDQHQPLHPGQERGHLLGPRAQGRVGLVLLVRRSDGHPGRRRPQAGGARPIRIH
ncbi:MAG: carbohydrate binding family 9 domain-containing protein [Gemmatimonadales bacterium]